MIFLLEKLWSWFNPVSIPNRFFTHCLLKSYDFYAVAWRFAYDLLDGLIFFPIAWLLELVVWKEQMFSCSLFPSPSFSEKSFDFYIVDHVYIMKNICMYGFLVIESGLNWKKEFWMLNLASFRLQVWVWNCFVLNITVKMSFFFIC